jgi:Leucine-rich repeat (LRR) protein
MKIEFLTNLSKIQKLHLNNNRISSINGLSGLTELRELNLSYNRIDKI